MKVQALMARDVATCGPDESLNRAAQLMWERDCGCVPVVDAQRRVLGMLTDRDVCMAAYTQGGRLSALRVSSAMAKRVASCRPNDTIQEAEAIMRANEVRRLPVVDAAGGLVGLLSLNDIAREGERERRARTREITPDEIAMALAAVCRHRGNGHDLVAAA